MSEIKVNSVKGVGASTAAITINNSDGTCTANITNRPNRNLIINGAMNVAQRGTSSTTNGYGSVDRFRTSFGFTDESPTQAQVDVASGTTPYTLGFRKAFKLTNGNQTGGAGASDFLQIVTKLEAQNIANSGWNYLLSSSYITLSFWVKSSVAQNFYATFRTADGTVYSYPFETGSLSADTWTKVTKTIPGNSNLTFNNDNGIGIQIVFEIFRGTDFTGSVTLNQWGVYAGATATPDVTSTWYTTNDATFEITGMQLEVGSVATNFEHRPFGQELALCQRYTIAYDLQGSVDNFMCLAQGRWFSGNQAQVYLPFPNELRGLPTIDATNTSSVGNFFLNSDGGLGGAAMTSLLLNERSNKGMTFTCENGASGQTAGLGTTIYCNGNNDAKLVITAEL